MSARIQALALQSQVLQALAPQVRALQALALQSRAIQARATHARAFQAREPQACALRARELQALALRARKLQARAFQATVPPSRALLGSAAALVLAAAAACVVGGPAKAQDVPLSSIDWLSDSLADPVALRPGTRPVPRPPRDTALGTGLEEVIVTPLEAPAAPGVGVVAPEQLGLTPGLWGPSTTDDLARRLARLPAEPLPAARDALKRLILARLDPPQGGGTPGALLTARVDALLRLGALEEANALLRAAGTDRPELFRRAFDIALLTGNEDRGCAVLQDTPGIAPSIQVRIFCLARQGDWPAAALTLDTAKALGTVSATEDMILARFLDPDLAENALLPLTRLPAPTPLQWRMLEAMGERQPTAPLPLAFAHADLRPTAGWRTQIEATERLVRAGALPADQLATLYGQSSPAASGGVWDRVAAMQALDAALADAAATTEGGQPLSGARARALARALEQAWIEMSRAGLALPFAEVTAPRLATLWPAGMPDWRGAALAQRIALLSADYEAAALAALDAATGSSSEPLFPLAVALAGPPA